MHIHYFQHNHFEDLGCIGVWAKSNNFTTSVTRFDLNPMLPSLQDFDWLVIMGGKMGVYDSNQYPWIPDEIGFIRKAINSGKVVIGICLGAQLIASSLGARVYKNSEPEMGFWPLQFSQEARKDNVFKHFPEELKVMHFHFDAFELPEGAVAMAKSPVTPVQAFRYGTNVFALQFHPELTESGVLEFINELTPEIVPGALVQNPEQMQHNIDCCKLNNEILSKVMDDILQLS